MAVSKSYNRHTNTWYAYETEYILGMPMKLNIFGMSHVKRKYKNVSA